jgi:hypothetical protein
MKKLEDIPKNHPFKVPEAYFDKLPGIIQSRIGQKEPMPYFRYAFQYALPVAILVTIAVIFFLPNSEQTVDTMLASVSTEELVVYLEQSDITTEELLESMDLNAENLEAIESELYNLDDVETLNELELELNNL